MKRLVRYLALTLTIWPLLFATEAFAFTKSRLIVKKKLPARGIMSSAFRVNDKEVHEFTKYSDLVAAKKRYETDSKVEWVVEDKIMKHFFVPGDNGSDEDEYWFLQWNLHNSESGINLPAAWDLTFGEEIVVAVVDTGITNHPDLNSSILQGADLITDVSIGNDGNGRDGDASDVGDSVGLGDECFTGEFRSSSWHGTHVAGTIAAKTGNGIGVAGVSMRAKIVPVRVLGKCGGWASDIADGIKWAAGVPVAGVANNQNPARVINLSLGGRGACNSMMQEAVDAANAAGSLVVVAAGNSNQNIDFVDYSPANCRGVVTVASTDENMNKSLFSNYGGKIDVSAPGGGGMGVMSTHNSGNILPGAPSYIELQGTSMSAPHVSGVAALMIGINPALSPAQLRAIIINSARSFSFSSSCTSSTCGAGVVDAEAAVLEALSTAGDPSFTFIEPITSSAPAPVTARWFSAQEEDSGGSCGTVEIDKGGGGGPFSLSLLFGLFLSFMLSHFRVHKPW